MLTFREYIGFSENYLNIAEEESGSRKELDWLLIPATILAWAAMEAFINNMLDDFSSLPNDLFALHERAFLLERRIKFNDKGDRLGEFSLESNEYRRLEDKIAFLIAKFGRGEQRFWKGNQLWQAFSEFKLTRDCIIHPRRGKEINLDIDKVNKYVLTSKRVIGFVSIHVWKQEVDF